MSNATKSPKPAARITFKSIAIIGATITMTSVLATPVAARTEDERVLALLDGRV